MDFLHVVHLLQDCTLHFQNALAQALRVIVHDLPDLFLVLEILKGSLFLPLLLFQLAVGTKLAILAERAGREESLLQRRSHLLPIKVADLSN